MNLQCRALLLVFATLGVSLPARAAEYTLSPQAIADEKAVFATVESLNVVPARARIGGTVAVLSVRNGDPVTQGQVLAMVGDHKLVLEMSALEAQIAGVQSQLLQAQPISPAPRRCCARAPARASPRRGAHRRQRGDQHAARPHRRARRDPPADGRGRGAGAGRGPRAGGAGDARHGGAGGHTIATVAERYYVLRLRVPERHAAFLKAGDPVRIDGAEAWRRQARLRPHHAGLSADRGRPRRRRRGGGRTWATISSARASGSGSRPARAPALHRARRLS